MARSDRTTTAVRRQLYGMGCSSFEIGVRQGATGHFLIRHWSSDQIIHALAWLKFRNTNGGDIYIRPASSQGLVLIDDLTRTAIATMKYEGFAPAVITETSPDNFQAWLRLALNFLRPDLATRAAHALAQRYQADPNSADWHHFGRLSGFSNRKPVHRSKSGLFPFVLLHEYSGCIAARGTNFPNQLREQDFAAPASPPSTTAPSPKRSLPPMPVFWVDGPLYKVQMDRILAAPGSAAWASSPDLSRLDFMIAANLCRDGYSREEVRAAIGHSPDIANRKVGHLHEYIRRTVDKVFTRYSPRASHNKTMIHPVFEGIAHVAS